MTLDGCQESGKTWPGLFSLVSERAVQLSSVLHLMFKLRHSNVALSLVPLLLLLQLVVSQSLWSLINRRADQPKLVVAAAAKARLGPLKAGTRSSYVGGALILATKPWPGSLSLPLDVQQ